MAPATAKHESENNPGADFSRQLTSSIRDMLDDTNSPLRRALDQTTVAAATAAKTATADELTSRIEQILRASKDAAQGEAKIALATASAESLAAAKKTAEETAKETAKALVSTATADAMAATRKTVEEEVNKRAAEFQERRSQLGSVDMWGQRSYHWLGAAFFGSSIVGAGIALFRGTRDNDGGGDTGGARGRR